MSTMSTVETLDQTVTFLAKRDGIDKVRILPYCDHRFRCAYSMNVRTGLSNTSGTQVLKLIRYTAKLIVAAKGVREGSAAYTKLKSLDSSLGTTRYSVCCLHAVQYSITSVVTHTPTRIRTRVFLQ